MFEKLERSAKLAWTVRCCMCAIGQGVREVPSWLISKSLAGEVEEEVSLYLLVKVVEAVGVANLQQPFLEDLGEAGEGEVTFDSMEVEGAAVG